MSNTAGHWQMIPFSACLLLCLYVMSRESSRTTAVAGIGMGQRGGQKQDSYVNVSAAQDSLDRESSGRYNRVISMGLYGDKPRYTYGALMNALLVERDWPGWKLRVYYDASVPSLFISRLESLGADMVFVNSSAGEDDQGGLIWRFYPMLDSSLTRFIVRDSDARLTLRDRKAVEEWIDTKAFFHGERDAPGHDRAIMGGLWGAVGGFITPALHQKLVDVFRNDAVRFDDDQLFLAEYVWPFVRSHAVIHDSYYCETFGDGTKETLPFPSKRTNLQDFVGNSLRSDEDFMGESLTVECPAKCRRDVSWNYC